MKTRYIVICGPVLIQPDLYLIMKSTSKELVQTSYGDNMIFPESEMGAEAVRNMVDDLIANKGTCAMIVTRYEHAVSQFALAVVEGKLSRDDVIFRLIRIEDGKSVVTDHRMTECNQMIGDCWPMGILG